LRPLEELRRDAPSALNAVLAKCLAKEPHARYQNVAEFAKALAPFAPERGRASVVRVVRIVESERGVATPPVSRDRAEDAPSDAPTIVSAGADVRQRAKRRPIVPIVALGGVVVVAAWSLWPAKGVEAPSAPPAHLTVATAEKPPLPSPPPERALVTPIATAEIAKADPSAASEVSKSEPRAPAPAFVPRALVPGPVSGTVTASSPAQVGDEPVASPVPSAEPLPLVTAPVASAPPAPPATPASSAPVSSARRAEPEYLMDIVERRRSPAKGNP
jgi:serine/threonine-protein kinase